MLNQIYISSFQNMQIETVYTRAAEEAKAKMRLALSVSICILI